MEAGARGPAGLQYYIDGGIFTSAPCPCPPSPARRLGTVRGRGHTSGPRNGRLVSWYETGSVGPAVHSITGILVLLVYILYYLYCPTINCWWYLHLRVHQQQPGDLALQVVNCVTVDLTLAGCRHGTKRGRGPRWMIVLLISYVNITARGGSCNSGPHSGMPPWHETGSGRGCLVLLITSHNWSHPCPCAWRSLYSHQRI